MQKLGTYIILIVIVALIGAITLIYNRQMFQMHIIPMDTKELVVTQMEFTTLSDSDIIILHVTYPDTLPVTVAVMNLPLLVVKLIERI